jgi:hypothetical protein
MEKFSVFLSEKVSLQDLKHAAQKDKDKTIMIMDADGKHYSLSLDAINDAEDGSVFADDEDGKSFEVRIKDISKID